MARSNFDYNLILEIPREAVAAYVAATATATTSAAIVRLTKAGKTEEVALLNAIRKEQKLAAMLATVDALKAQA